VGTELNFVRQLLDKYVLHIFFTPFYTRGLGKDYLLVMVPEPYGFSFAVLKQVMVI
jgi:hypothetical protein